MQLHMAIAVWVIASGAGGGDTRLALAPCRPAGAAEDVLCGRIELPENPAAKEGRRISLNVVVLPALGAERREPLFDLIGGPGVAATRLAGMYTTETRAYRARRDVVLVDQRGTGESNGLHCRRRGTPFARAMGEMYPPDYVRECRSELEKKADLRFYTTSISADDLDRVREALGYDTIHVLGTSYGTRLAQEYVRRHGRHVKSMMLFGAVPPWASMPLYHAASGHRALDLLCDECAADPACAGRYPDLREKLRQVLRRLRQQPATVSRDGESALLGADVFAEALRRLLYTPASSRRVPKVIHAAAAGDWAPFIASAPGEYPGADGAYLSITCSEDVARIDRDEARRLAAGTYLGDYRVRQQMRACADWPRAHVPADFWDDVRSSVPALIYAGYRDPVTPPAWADAVAAQLPNATVALMDRHAHMPDGLGGMECWDGLVMRFLDQGAVRPADLACVSRMTAPPFE
jgi:pimeloyl-ACP methyl ester carboxylesterase